MPNLSPLIREDIYGRLREDILTCALMPGAELREAELAERFGVSTSPIRDALLRLEVDGLVRVFPRRGYRIASISLQDAADLFELRAAIEQAAVLQASKRASEADLIALDQFRRMPADGAFIAENRRFHRWLVALSGNRRMTRLGHDLIDQFDRLVRVSIAVAGRNTPRLVQEHGRIIDALQARNGRRAARLLGDHVLRARERVLDGLARAIVA